MNNKEIWREVKGYEGYYEVSNLGNVRALERIVCDGRMRPAKSVTKRKDNLGYFHVGLNKNRKETTIRIQRLVAQAFIPNPENKPYLDHINTIRTDNRVDNLRWVTPKENYHNKLSRKKSEYTIKMNAFRGRINNGSRSVLEYNLNGNFIKEWISISRLMESTNIKSNSLIYACADRKRRHHKCRTYRWKEGDNIPKKIETGLSEREIETITERWKEKVYECTDDSLF